MNGPLVDRLQLLPVEVGDDGFLFWYGGCLLVDSTDRLDQFQHLQKDDPTNAIRLQFFFFQLVFSCPP